MSLFTVLMFEVHNSFQVHKLGGNLNQMMCIQRTSSSNKLSAQGARLDLLQNSLQRCTMWRSGSHQQVHSTNLPPLHCSSSMACLCGHVSSLWRSDHLHRVGDGTPVGVS